jgi:ABC-type phosphate/phosphonate transport system substrate-binding protein
MGALHHLEQHGLRADKDYKVVEYRTHASVVHALLSGASAMAVTTTHGLHQLPAEQRARIAVYRSVSDLPAFVIMAAPGFSAGRLETLRAGLLALPTEVDGRDFLAQNSYTGVHPADEAAMRRADRYLKETRRMVKSLP